MRFIRFMLKWNKHISKIESHIFSSCQNYHSFKHLRKNNSIKHFFYRKNKQTKTTPCLLQSVNSTQCEERAAFGQALWYLGTRTLHVTEKIEEIISFHTTVIFISNVLLMIIKRVKNSFMEYVQLTSRINYIYFLK